MSKSKQVRDSSPMDVDKMDEEIVDVNNLQTSDIQPESNTVTSVTSNDLIGNGKIGNEREVKINDDYAKSMREDIQINLKAGYEGYLESFYTDINLPTDLSLMFNQSIGGSKDFNSLRAKELIDGIDEYRKQKIEDNAKEHELMYKFGILLKNINDYKRSVLGIDIPKEGHATRHLDWEKIQNNFSKTCISYGYFIPNDLSFTDESMIKDKSMLMQGAQEMFKQSVVFPNCLKSKSENSKRYCALYFLYCGYHVVILNDAQSQKNEYIGKISQTPLTDDFGSYVENGMIVAASSESKKQSNNLVIGDSNDTVVTNGKRTKKATRKKKKKADEKKNEKILQLNFFKDKNSKVKTGKGMENDMQVYNNMKSDDTTFIYFNLLVRQDGSTQTHKIVCYVKYVESGIDIYVATSEGEDKHQVTTFSKLDNKKMENFTVYWKE